MIQDYIPKGQMRSISRKELQELTGFTDREIREQIEQSEALIINLQDGNGYFKPLPSEIDLVQKYYYQERKRALSVIKKLSKVRRWLKKIGQTEIKEVV